MPSFRVGKLPLGESRVDRLVEAMARFDLEPDYQRQSGVWNEEKKQLFVDSLINGYDVPKLYFHRLGSNKREANRFAIIDGKQRLETVRSFLGNEFPLSDEFVDSQAESEGDAAAGMEYGRLTREHPALAARLTQYELDVVVIETADLEIIEELFSRLNEAVPLNAPEKRNALRGAMPPIIRRLVSRHPFFRNRLPIENTRYRQFDLVTKFLLLTERGDFVATKKRALDDFVKAFRDGKGKPRQTTKASALAGEVTAILDDMTAVFLEQDELLTSVGLVTVYFMAFLMARTNRRLKKVLTRERLLQFDQVRRHNRVIQREQESRVAAGRGVSQTRVRQDLASFDRLMQSPNDGEALKYRFKILQAFLEDHNFTESLPAELKRRMGIA